MNLTRRQFLIRCSMATGGLAMLSSCGLVPVLPTFGGPADSDAYTWVQLTPEGHILILCPRAEMGQDIVTGLSQIVADELLVTIESIQCVYPTTAQIPPSKMTVGSESIEIFAAPLALAAASLRETLRMRAAAQLNEPVSAVQLTNLAFESGSKTISFPELVANGSVEVLEANQISPRPELYSDKPDARSVGRMQTPVHCRNIVTGAETYSRDARIDGMTFGAVARPPWLGAKLLGWDETAANNIEGVIQVVAGQDDTVGLIADTPMALRKGLDALACQWEALTENQRAAIDEINDIDQAVADNLLDHEPVSTGDIKRGMTSAVHSINVRYDTPLVAHASMEPRAGLAYIEDGICYVHTGSQDPWYVQGAVARATGFSKDKVIVQNHRMGGGFGGRIHCQASVEAAWLAKTTGRPVKVQWSREEEFTRNYAGPGFSHRIQASVDENGKICAWHHQMAGSPVLTTSALVPPHLHWAANLAPDPGTWRGAETSYQFENQQVEFADIRRPMHTGAWRGLGAAPNTFAVECAMDELAQAAEADPITFRVRHALNPRLSGVLEQLRDELPDNPDTHTGIAAGAYKGVTFVAVAARVDSDGQLLDLRCVHDCGRIINPSGVRAQVEGCLVWGIGMALKEEFRVINGIGETNNFSRYKVPRITDIPPMQIILVQSDEKSSGAGEAAFPPTAAAIVNAVARAKGRSRSLPLTA